MSFFPEANVGVGDALIDEALDAIREHFGMPVAYLSRIDGDRSIFRRVSAPGLEALIKPGDEKSLGEVYCPHILNGDLPNLIPDTAAEPICQDMPITQAVPIGSHISLPVLRPDGSPYGMFCCLSPEPNPSLNDRDLAIMRNFANLVTRQIQFEIEETDSAAAEAKLIADVIANRLITPVFQPLVQMSNGEIAGVEALSRFDPSTGLNPEQAFTMAAECGLGQELELAALAQQLEALPMLPPGKYMSFNASADLICNPAFIKVLPKDQAQKLVIEVTEHSQAADEDQLLWHIHELKSQNFRIAVDDVGAGYSGWQRIARLEPDLLKIDRSIVAGVDQSLAQRAIVAALMHFSKETGAKVLVEGVETMGEAKILSQLGVDLAQGWLFARPAPMHELFLNQNIA